MANQAAPETATTLPDAPVASMTGDHDVSEAVDAPAGTATMIVAAPGFVLAAELAPGSTILVPVEVTEVAKVKAGGVRLTFADGTTLSLDDDAPVRVS